jgi:hypothetical protein
MASIPYRKQEKSKSCQKQNLANGTAGILRSGCFAISNLTLSYYEEG